MNIRQAEYLKLLGIQAWCQQEDLPQVQENLRAIKQAERDANNALQHEHEPSHHRTNNPVLNPSDNVQERPNFASDANIDPERFRKQLAGVTEGLRVQVAPKVTENIAVKSEFLPEAFSYPQDQSIFLPKFSEAIKSCLGCEFSQDRYQATLPRQSNAGRIMVITDIPLKEEMLQGQVLDKSDESFFFKAMNAVGLSADDLYITPFIKCRPPELRDVSDKEWHACFNVLKREILEVKPAMIFLLGRTSVKFLLQKEQPFELLRRKVHRIMIEGEEFPVVISHSPRVYAKNSRLKANFWQDMKYLRRQLGEF
ncbi:uracil-DNA glycosylase [Ignatzschineria sp. LJL83]